MKPPVASCSAPAPPDRPRRAGSRRRRPCRCTRPRPRAWARGWVSTVSASDRLPPMPSPSSAAHSPRCGRAGPAPRGGDRAVVRATDTAIHGRAPPVRWASAGMANAVTIWVAVNTPAGGRPRGRSCRGRCSRRRARPAWRRTAATAAPMKSVPSHADRLRHGSRTRAPARSGRRRAGIAAPVAAQHQPDQERDHRRHRPHGRAPPAPTGRARPAAARCRRPRPARHR